MLKDYQKQLLDLLEQLELEISGLYKLFAEKFPERQDLWNHLSVEEVKHAACINRLKSLAQEENVLFDEKMTKTYTVKSVLNDIKDKYEKTRNDNYTIINALSFSLSLEQSILERRFYDFFSAKDTDSMLMIKTIREETSAHEAMVKKALEQEKKR